jgi:hypothetical protein
VFVAPRSVDEDVRAGLSACDPLAHPASHPLAASLVEQRLRWYCHRMTLKARVKAGRLVVDEPTDLPEGTEVELLPLDPGDWLGEEDRAALHKALKDSDEDIKAGRLVDADVILRELRSR